MFLVWYYFVWRIRAKGTYLFEVIYRPIKNNSARAREKAPQPHVLYVFSKDPDSVGIRAVWCPMFFIHTIFESHHDKMVNAYADSVGPDQTAHSRNLISAYGVRLQIIDYYGTLKRVKVLIIFFGMICSLRRLIRIERNSYMKTFAPSPHSPPALSICPSGTLGRLVPILKRFKYLSTACLQKSSPFAKLRQLPSGVSIYLKTHCLKMICDFPVAPILFFKNNL